MLFLNHGVSPLSSGNSQILVLGYRDLIQETYPDTAVAPRLSQAPLILTTVWFRSLAIAQ